MQQSHSWAQIQGTQTQQLKIGSHAHSCAIHNNQELGITKCLSAGERKDMEQQHTGKLLSHLSLRLQNETQQIRNIFVEILFRNNSNL